MGKGSTTIKQPPPIDPGKAMGEYLFGQDFTNFSGVTDPELQNRLLAAEAQFRPQYTALELADQEAALFGMGGQAGLLDMQSRAAEIAGQQDTLQKQREMAQLQQFGPEYTAAVRAADPESFEAAQATRGLADTFAEDRAGVMDAVADIEAETARGQAQLAEERAGIEGTIGDIQSATARAETAFDEDIAGFQDAQARALEDRAGFQEQAKGFQDQATGFEDQAKAFQAEADRLGVDVENLDPRVDMLSQLSADEAQRLASEASVDDPRLTKLQALQQKQAETLYSESEGRLSAERAREADQAARMAGAARGRVGDASTLAQELLGRESSRARLREEARSAGGLASQQQGMIASQRSQRARDAMAAGQLGFGMQTGAESMRQGRRGQAMQMSQLGLQAGGMGLQAGGLGLQAGRQGLQAGQQALQAGQLGMTGREAGIQAGRAGRQQELQARQLGLGATQAGTSLGLQGQQMGLSARRLGSQLGQAQQGALGQAFNQFRATGGDPTAFLFGRPSLSGSLGTQAYGQAFNLAAQQQGPQLFDPNMGINMAMQQRSQDASLLGAQAQANATQGSGMMGLMGSVIGGPIGGGLADLIF